MKKGQRYRMCNGANNKRWCVNKRQPVKQWRRHKLKKNLSHSNYMWNHQMRLTIFHSNICYNIGCSQGVTYTQLIPLPLKLIEVMLYKYCIMYCFVEKRSAKLGPLVWNCFHKDEVMFCFPGCGQKWLIENYLIQKWDI